MADFVTFSGSVPIRRMGSSTYRSPARAGGARLPPAAAPAVPLRPVPGGPRASGAGALSHMRTPGRGVDGLGSVVAGSQLGAGRNWCTIKYIRSWAKDAIGV